VQKAPGFIRDVDQPIGIRRVQQTQSACQLQMGLDFSLRSESDGNVVTIRGTRTATEPLGDIRRYRRGRPFQLPPDSVSVLTRKVTNSPMTLLGQGHPALPRD